MVTEERIRLWFDWLKRTYPTDNPPELIIAPPEYDTIADNDGNPSGFGVFIPDDNRIIVLSNFRDAANREEEVEFVFTSLAHEYRHHIQWTEGETFEDQQNFKKWRDSPRRYPWYEKDAERFARTVYELYFGIHSKRRSFVYKGMTLFLVLIWFVSLRLQMKEHLNIWVAIVVDAIEFLVILACIEQGWKRRR